MSKNTQKCVAYIKVCYILKGRNTREHLSPDFVMMDFQKSLVQYSLPKLMCRLSKSGTLKTVQFFGCACGNLIG